jgi:hypothetical protein
MRNRRLRIGCENGPDPSVIGNTWFRIGST